jgi:hypothetical protein
MFILFILIFFILVFLFILMKNLKANRLISYIDTICLNKKILSYVVFYIIIFLFHCIYMIYIGDFEYCSNNLDHLDSSSNNTPVNEGNFTRNPEENPVTINGDHSVVSDDSNTSPLESDQARAQEIRSQLTNLTETRLALMDRHDELRSDMLSLEASNNSHNNPVYDALDQEDMHNRELVDAIVEEEDRLDLELKAIEPSHVTVNEAQMGITE